ncbi:hypothetical protein A9Q81_20080 [Gammaproteobacteria bacterium 42_54_T18]|nr:hypothetical protein A9Q81_20080 [Gammaproteobacteria bacterium 42_54_T18]
MSSFGNIALDKNKVAATHFSDLVEMQRHACSAFAKKPLYGTKIGDFFEWTVAAYAVYGLDSVNIKWTV